MFGEEHHGSVHEKTYYQDPPVGVPCPEAYR